jgi:tetratricopeptide (TPR) repeat protein
MIRPRTAASVAVAAALLAACSVKRIQEEPILSNGDRIPTAERAVERARLDAARDQGVLAARRDSLAAVALASCVGATCGGVARGEVTLGMSAAQVMAATGTTPEAWVSRQAGDATVLAPLSRDQAPRDAAGNVALVQLRGGRVTSVSYAEPSGVRTVASEGDAAPEGRARARAEALVREGDDYAAAGDLRRALDRYDRASVLRADDPMLDYRIATVLDKQLRPVEALIRYQLFLQRLEIERIEAVGNANAKLADAIARARERVIVLERQAR